MQELNTDVLVIGAGPAGLTAAAALARLGASALTVTKYGGTADSPRAHITNQRAVEIFRDFGIEERVRARALPQALMGKQVFATSFAGREISRLMTWGTGDDRYADYKTASPCEMCNAPQHLLEPILLDAARGFGADIRFNHEVVGVRQTAECVLTSVRNRVDGSELEIRSRYAIGCDGARTIVGDNGDFRFEGRAGLANSITVWIEADLTRYTKHRSGALFFTCSPGSDDVFSIWTCVEPWTEWSTIFLHHDGAVSEVSEEAVMARVRAAVGDPEIPIRIKKISEWQFNHIVAGLLPRSAAVPRRRRRAPSSTRERPGEQHVDPGHLQSGVEAGAGARRRGERVAPRQLSPGETAGRPSGRRPGQQERRGHVPLHRGSRFSPGSGSRRCDAGLGSDFRTRWRGDPPKHCGAVSTSMNWQFNAHGVELGQRYESAAVASDGTSFPPYERDARALLPSRRPIQEHRSRTCGWSAAPSRSRRSTCAATRRSRF